MVGYGTTETTTLVDSRSICGIGLNCSSSVLINLGVAGHGGLNLASRDRLMGPAGTIWFQKL